MAEYKITNDSSLGRGYTADNGSKVSFEPGESKELSSLPPDPEKWRIEKLEEREDTKTSENNTTGGENN